MRGNFQIIIIALFIGLAVFGVLVFSGAIPIGNDNSPGALGAVVLWGTVRGDAMLPLMERFNATNPSFVVKYVQKSSDSFDQDLLEALASGTGPDMIFLPHDLAFHYANKILVIPYQSFSLASFKNNFAGAGEVFLTTRGIVALPLSIDPLVMYYNRSILDSNEVVFPPAFWDDFAGVVPEITERDASNRVIKSAVALGHFSNVTHAKDILSALFMQAGNGIVAERNGIFDSLLDRADSLNSLATVLKFYTDFADPTEPVYSWNKSFAQASEVFSSGDTAFYFGYASELASLTARNPNLNFGAAPVPQMRNKPKATMSRVTGIAVLSSSKNATAALTAAGLLSTGDFASEFAGATGTAPARRDLLSAKKSDAFSPIIYSAALYARSWLDPSPKDTNEIWRRMIDSVLSGGSAAAGAVSDAGSRLRLLLQK
ncbi:extracellular solute-binding protein [Candidatus Nomurabacteria bacterium]|nr:extracellular solute-binding protein [Candidatus Nomurabacteria bacterium]